MDVLGLGVDIEDIKRFNEMRLNITEKNFKRTFTEAEIKYCNGKLNSDEHYCGRFAAKEAVVKCLGIPRNNGFVLSEIEILGSDNGSPICKLHGSVDEFFKKKGGGKITLSISHTRNSTVSIALLSR